MSRLARLLRSRHAVSTKDIEEQTAGLPEKVEVFWSFRFRSPTDPRRRGDATLEDGPSATISAPQRRRKADGGLELPGKVVQERLGHSTIGMTMDTYGHLFPRGDDAAELAAAERLLLG
jgi:integrase